MFLKALSMLPTRLKIRGYIIGDAIYATDGSQHSVADLRAIAESLGIADRVGFTGFVADVPAAMRALDVVVHASTEPEPFGMVIAEAMACGRAVVASAAGGAAELISDGVDSLGHAPGDAARLAEWIERLATEAELRSRVGAAGRATAEARFGSARLAAELIPIYWTLKTPVSLTGRQSVEMSASISGVTGSSRPRRALTLTRAPASRGSRRPRCLGFPRRQPACRPSRATCGFARLRHPWSSAGPTGCPTPPAMPVCA